MTGRRDDGRGLAGDSKSLHVKDRQRREFGQSANATSRARSTCEKPIPQATAAAEREGVVQRIGSVAAGTGSRGSKVYKPTWSAESGAASEMRDERLRQASGGPPHQRSRQLAFM